MSIVDHTPVATAALDSGALLEFSRLLNTLDDPAAIYGNVLLALMGKMGLSGGGVALPDGDRFVVSLTKGRASSLKGCVIAWHHGPTVGVVPLDTVDQGGKRGDLTGGGVERILPVVFGSETQALILLGASLTGRSFGGTEESYAQVLAGIAAIAVEGCRARNALREANRRLERRIHRLRSLFEASREFNALLAPEAILRLLGFSLMGEMAIRRFAVAIHDSGEPSLVVNRFGEDFPSELLESASASGPRLFRADAIEELDRRLYERGVRAAVPMEVQRSVRGLLLVGERLHAPIDDEDLEYLASISNLAVGALENMRLLEEMIVKQRMEEDLRIAAEIQKGLLPSLLPMVEGFSIAARTIPTHQVGGDFYDAIALDNGSVLLAIADVSGKGTPASLLMANIQAAIRTLSGLALDLADMVARVNDLLYRNTSSDKFVTAFFGVLDPVARTLRYVNAGHNPPFLFREGETLALDRGGLLLGIMPSIIPYEVGEVVLGRGEMLILYTDGVSEALNPDREEFGEDRLKSLFEGKMPPDPSRAIDRLREALQVFADGAPQSDDITAVVVVGE